MLGLLVAIVVVAITGTQISLPCPSYSVLLALISACSDRIISHNDTRIGFEFKSVSTNIEIERTDRLFLDDKGNLKQHTKGQGVLKRQIHFRPRLDLYVTNLELARSFTNPAAPPCLGRSQDLLWITEVESIKLTPSKSGNIGSTMITKITKTKNIPSLIVRCAEWFDNEAIGRTRIVGPIGYYQAIPPNVSTRINVTMPHLYHPSNFTNPEDVIYLHEWLTQ